MSLVTLSLQKFVGANFNVRRTIYAFGDIQSVLKLLKLRNICVKQRYFILYKQISDPYLYIYNEMEWKSVLK
jgi:hypothetical protein